MCSSKGVGVVCLPCVIKACTTRCHQWKWRWGVRVISFHRHLSFLCRRRCTISTRFLETTCASYTSTKRRWISTGSTPSLAKVRFHCVLRQLAMFPGNRLCSQPHDMLTVPTCGCMTTRKSVCARYVVPSAAGLGCLTWDMLLS